MIGFAVIILFIVLLEAYFAKSNADYLGALRRTDRYLVEFRHLYYKTKSISDVLEQIDAGGMEGAEKIRLYRLFKLHCEIVRENGDTTDEKGSVFLRGISYIRKELAEEIRALEGGKAEFSGMSLVCCAPLMLTGLIEKWALSGIPEMAGFYTGMGGSLTRVLLGGSVLLGYLYVVAKREEERLATIHFKRFFEGVRRKRNRVNEAKEVKELRSIIIMIKDIKGMTVLKILEVLAGFSELFSKAIRTCLNEYSFMGRDALKKLKEESDSEEFKIIADKLLFCDVAGVKAAFEEIVLEQENFVREQRFMEKEALKKQAVFTYIISMIPMCIVVVLYLTLPFVLESMGMVEEIIKNINEWR